MSSIETNSDRYSEPTSSESAEDTPDGSATLSPGMDNLLCGITSLRDANGVVSCNACVGLTAFEKRCLTETAYDEDEIYPKPTLIEKLNLSSIKYGWVNNTLLKESSGGYWRDLVGAGLPVKEALSGVLFEAMLSTIRELPPHLFFAIESQPEIARNAAEEIITAFKELNWEEVQHWVSNGWNRR